METIKYAAVIAENGLILFGKSHSDCFEKAHTLNIEMSSQAKHQGFLTSNGLFVDRYKAAEIAFDSGQIDHKINLLFSEDLWSFKGKFDYLENEGYIKRYDLIKKENEELKERLKTLLEENKDNSEFIHQYLSNLKDKE